MIEVLEGRCFFSASPITPVFDGVAPPPAAIYADAGGSPARVNAPLFMGPVITIVADQSAVSAEGPGLPPSADGGDQFVPFDASAKVVSGAAAKSKAVANGDINARYPTAAGTVVYSAGVGGDVTAVVQSTQTGLVTEKIINVYASKGDSSGWNLLNQVAPNFVDGGYNTISRTLTLNLGPNLPSGQYFANVGLYDALGNLQGVVGVSFTV